MESVNSSNINSAIKSLSSSAAAGASESASVMHERGKKKYERDVTNSVGAWRRLSVRRRTEARKDDAVLVGSWRHHHGPRG